MTCLGLATRQPLYISAGRFVAIAPLIDIRRFDVEPQPHLVHQFAPAR
jgi:hypothetical protein